MTTGLSARTSARIGAVVRWVLRIVLLAWVLTPFAAMFLVSVQTRAESLRIPPDWVPEFDFSAYGQILSRALSNVPASTPADFIWPGIVHSAVVGIGVATINVVAGSWAGYAYARFQVPGRTSVPLIMLATQMVPPFALLIPYYVVLRALGLTNTHIGVIVALLSVTIPFTVWLLRAYFESIPVELDRAARMDGCTRTRAFVQVILPLARPGLIAVSLFAFMVAWNDILFSLILISDNDAMLVQPAISGLYNIREQSLSIMAAGTILAAIPTMLLAMLTQRFLVKGMLAGARKG